MFLVLKKKSKEIISSNVFQSFTVEPSMFLYYLSFGILELINTNLYLQKACRVNATCEPDLDTRCDDEKAGVTFISFINTNFKLPMHVIMLLYVVFGSSWSDKAGRRRTPLIYLPMFSQLLQSSMGMVHSYFWTWSPISAALLDISTQAFAGGHLLFRMSTYMYLFDVSSVEDRTMRLGIMNSIKSLSTPIANAYVAGLLHRFGFFYSYLLCFGLTCLSISMAVLLIKDISYPVERKVTVLSVIRWSTVTDGFKVVFKKSLGEKRFIVYALLCLHVILWFSTEGEKSVLYLYLRYKFNWDERMYSLYSTYRLIGIIVGTIFCSIFLSKYLKIHDGLIGAFAGFWDTLAVIGFLFATKNWHLYVIPIVDIFHGVAIAVYYSYLSKFYESNEFGRLSSSLNIFSLIIPLYNPVYNILFQKTLDFFPSAFFLVSVVVDITICILYSTTYVLGKKYGM
ncbi:uncharacterized protein LOC135838963 isoform X1 [Planococcus citri]|uniref:uncharacterized protein LOC135838963 isoform X1 n=1 Tax=Planococcus citri TaxID=170843 RepID=UPI0031F8B7B6